MTAARSAGSDRLSGGKKRANPFISIIFYVILILFALLVALPILWGFITSVKGEGEISRFPPTFVPEVWNFGNYYKVMVVSSFRTYFFNSILVTGIGIIVSTIIAGHAAYALARFGLKHADRIMFAILMTGMVPAVALLIPLYLMSIKLNLYDTRLMLIIVYTAWRTPMLTWILKGFFESTPLAIEEAAMIDGCSRVRTFYQIVVPISQPALASSALLTAVYIWNDFLVSSSFVSSNTLRTVSFGLYQYVSQYGVRWGELMAALMVTIIPVIILFICLQRRFVDGMAAGAVKG